MATIRRFRGVPAKRGGRVRYLGGDAPKLGTIVGARGGYLRIRLDGEDYIGTYHPTWELEFLDDAPCSAVAKAIDLRGFDGTIWCLVGEWCLVNPTENELKIRSVYIEEMKRLLDWKHMDSAPRDQRLLGIVEGNITMIRWGKTSHVPIYGWIDLIAKDLCQPSHWLPLPDYPHEVSVQNV